MMFMMPMPPTRSDTAAMPASSAVNVAVVSLSTLSRSAWLRMLKSFGWSWRRRCVRRSAVWISPIATGERVFRVDARPDVVDPIGAEDLKAPGLERDEDLLVGVAEAGRTLSGHHADHRELPRRDADLLADDGLADRRRRAAAGRRRRARRRARDPCSPRGVNMRPSAIVKPRTSRKFGAVPVTCTFVFLLRHTTCSGRSCCWLTPTTCRRALDDRLHVRHAQLCRRRRADAALLHALRIDLEDRRSEPRDAILDGVLRAVAERDHRDHRADADDDAEHREQRPQLVGAQRREARRG